MIHAQRTKTVMLHGPATAATSATASARVDTLGFRYCTFNCVLGGAATATNSSAKWGVLKITDGDTTTLGTGAIVNLTGTTNTVTDATNGFVIAPHNDTSVSQMTKLHCNLVGRKRYLFVTYQAAASHSTVMISAELSRAEEMPNTAAEMGVGVAAIG